MDNSNKKGAPAVVVCCLLLLSLLVYASDASEETNSAKPPYWPLCDVVSKTFKGQCVLDAACTTACKGEGMLRGFCRKSTCICLNPCTSQ